MDSTVAATLATQLGVLADTATDQIGTVLPLGIAAVATVAGVFFAIKLIRGMLHM